MPLSGSSAVCLHRLYLLVSFRAPKLRVFHPQNPVPWRKKFLNKTKPPHFRFCSIPVKIEKDFWPTEPPILLSLH
jgi:hypothetical protein